MFRFPPARPRALCLVLLASLSAAPALAGIEFSPPLEFAAGTQPFRSALADFDGDGDLDACVLANNAASILERSSTGDFTITATLPVNTPMGVALADFDGDGDVDVIVGCEMSPHLVPFFNDGAGHFTVGTPFHGDQSRLSGLLAGDWNGDARPDLAVTRSCVSGADSVFCRSQMVDILLNLGGSWSAPTSIDAGGGDMEAGDLEPDGDLDLFAANDRGFDVLQNNGMGSFTPLSRVYNNGAPSGIAVADFTGDHVVDVAAANGSGFFTTYGGNGVGAFSDLGDTPLYALAIGLDAADFDNDGLMDVVTSSPDNHTATVRHGNGDGTFDHPTLYFSTGPQAISIQATVGDLDGDGIPDLVVCNRTSGSPFVDGSISVLRGGRVDKCGRRDFEVGVASYAIASDLNADGFVDLASVTEGNTLAVLLADGAGGFASPVNYAVGNLDQAMTVADLDGDTRPDLVAANYEDNTLSVFFNDGAGGFGTPITIPTPWGPRFVASADLNGDGLIELISGDYHGDLEPGTVSVYINKGGRAFAPGKAYASGYGPYEVSVGDLDGDGTPDLCVNNYDDRSVSLYFNKKGDGTFASPTYVPTGWGLSTAIADLDGDGDNDLAVCNFKESTVSLLFNNGAGGFSGRVDIPVGQAPRCIVPFHADADGDIDLAVVISATSQIKTMRNDGTGAFTVEGDCQVGINPKTLTVADVDKNGGLDLISANGGSGTISILYDVAPAMSAPGAVMNSKRPRNLNPPAGPVRLAFALAPPSPNPLRHGSDVTFAIELPSAGPVELAVYDIAGRVVSRVQDGDLAAGVHRFAWNATAPDGSRVRAGTYFVRMRGGNEQRVRTLVVQ